MIVFKIGTFLIFLNTTFFFLNELCHSVMSSVLLEGFMDRCFQSFWLYDYLWVTFFVACFQTLRCHQRLLLKCQHLAALWAELDPWNGLRAAIELRLWKPKAMVSWGNGQLRSFGSNLITYLVYYRKGREEHLWGSVYRLTICTLSFVVTFIF